MLIELSTGISSELCNGCGEQLIINNLNLVGRLIGEALSINNLEDNVFTGNDAK